MLDGQILGRPLTFAGALQISGALTQERQRRADFRATKTSLWVKVPTKVKGDQEI